MFRGENMQMVRAGAIRWFVLPRGRWACSPRFISRRPRPRYCSPSARLRHGGVAAVGDPSGIVAALLLLGNRVWPGIWLGAALANLAVASSPFAALAIGSGNT